MHTLSHGSEYNITNIFQVSHILPRILKPILLVNRVNIVHFSLNNIADILNISDKIAEINDFFTKESNEK